MAGFCSPALRFSATEEKKSWLATATITQLYTLRALAHYAGNRRDASSALPRYKYACAISYVAHACIIIRIVRMARL